MVKTYADLYLDARKALLPSEGMYAGNVARELVCAASGKTQEALIADRSLYASEEICLRVENFVCRHLTGEPTAYILGQWDFADMTLTVTPDVLIPRDDSMAVTELAIKKALFLPQNPRVLDLCTGSGCIGLAVARRVKDAKITLAVRTYAIKIFSKKLLKEDQEKASIVLNEIRIHRSLRHEHICKYEHCFEDTDNVYILMEYCPNGTLLDLLKSRKKLEEIEIRFYMFQVLKVLKYFRIQKIVHRDLTLKNIFLKDNKNIKISDFGLAYNEYEYDEKSGLICGTPGYFTPESKLCKYSYKTDIFCFGMCIYYLFGGSTKFITSQQSYEFFSNNLFEPEKKIKLSEEALDLLKKLVAIEGKRIGLEQIYIHPFFNKGIGLEKKNFPDYNDKDYMEKIKELNIKFGIKPIERNIKQNLDNSNLNNNINNGINFRGSFKEILVPKIQEKNNIISSNPPSGFILRTWSPASPKAA